MGRLKPWTRLRTFYSRLSLRQQIILPFFVIFLSVLMLSTIILGSWFSSRLETNLRQEVEAFAARVGQDLEHQQEDLQAQVRLVANRDALQAAIQQKQTGKLLQLLLPLKAEFGFDLLQVVDSQGRLIVDLRRAELNATQLQNQAARLAASSGLYLSDYMTTVDRSAMLMVAIAPVRVTQGTLGGVILGRRIDDALLERIAIGSSKAIAAFADNHLLATTLPWLRPTRWQPPAIGEAASRMLVDRRGFIVKSLKVLGASKTDLVLALLYPVAALDTAQQDLWLQLIGVFGLGGVTVAIVGTLLARGIADRLDYQFNQLQTALSDLKNTQSQLVQAEKMSSLGQLVAGIAHEVNNPINFISGNINHLKHYMQDLVDLVHLYQARYPKPDSDITDRMEEIDLEFLVEDVSKVLHSMQVGVDRVSQIILSLRNFSRLDEAEMKRVDLHEGLDNTLLILNHRFNRGIRVVKDYGALPPIECYPAQLNQVFMNLLVNAIDALEAAQALRDLSTFSAKIRIQTRQASAHQVQVCIADNGVGMSAETQQKIFDAFFTTKPIGQGTGLGLSIAYTIIEQHQGRITVQSEINTGTEFTIVVPISRCK